MSKTLAEKVWDAHVVRSKAGEPDLIYIDLHLIHEVTSPQAYRRSATEWQIAASPQPHPRHGGPQHADLDIDKPIADPVSRTQLETLRSKQPSSGSGCTRFGDVEQGICTSSVPARPHQCPA